MLSTIDLKISNLEKILGLNNRKNIFQKDYEIPTNQDHRLDSVDTTLFVGDNLPNLKYLAHSYPKTVDMCYIDPPYNTGSEFLYEDSRKAEEIGIFGSHSLWMSFMLPRLVYAKEVLKDTGVIAISIDDYEQAYLKILMDRIFGEGHFIGSVVSCRSKNGKGSKKNIAPNHEYLLMYGKSPQSILRGQPDTSLYDKEDSFGKYRIDGLFRKKGDASLKSDRPNMYYALYFNPISGQVSVDPIEGWKTVYPVDSKGVDRRWLWSMDTARGRAWQLYASKNGVVYVKNYKNINGTEKRIKVRTLWTDTDFYTERGTNEVKKIFGTKVFDTPKPLEYIKKIIDVCSDKDAMILDFFAGSGTTAQAISELNATDDGERKCILMETNTQIPSKHLARNAGFSKVSDITVNRLSLIKEDNPAFKFQVVYNKYDQQTGRLWLNQLSAEA